MSFYAKNPYGDLNINNLDVSIIGSKQRKNKEMLVMVQPKDVNLLDQTVMFDKSFMNDSRRLNSQRRLTEPKEIIYKELEEKQTTEIFYYEKVNDWQKRISSYP
jgi:hypothetical protein